MAANDDHVITTWRIAATPEEISAVLGDAPALARWWPSVYLAVDEIPRATNGTRQGRGAVHEGLPALHAPRRFTVTESQPPTGFRIEATGDFVGRGIWTLRQDAGPNAPGGPKRPWPTTGLVIAEKGILKTFSLVMKPIFSANHHWAMARGEESLTLELARRHLATDPTITPALPKPPGPTFPHSLRRFRRG